MTKILRRSVVLAVGLATVAAAEQSPDEPARGEWDFSPQKVWEIDCVGDEPLRKPAELRVSSGGMVYFHDFDRHVSYACDEEGKLVGTFARQGRGKGEVSRYMNCVAGDDQVVILAPDKVHFYTSEGAFVDSVSNNLFERFPLLYLGGREFLFGPGALTDARGRVATILRGDVTAGNAKPFARVNVTNQDRRGPPGAVVLGLTPQILAARDPETGTFFYGKNSEYKIHVADDGGETRSTFGLKRASARVSKEAKRAHFDALGVPSEAAERLVEALPNKAAYYQRLGVNRGLVYVFLVPEMGVPQDGQQIDIFSPDGTYLYRAYIRFTEGKRICGGPENLRIQGDRFYVILEDDKGARTVAAYSITLPGAQARREAGPRGEYIHLTDISTPRTEHRIDVGGRKLHGRVYGSGSPAVVLVSGFGAPQEIWNPIVPDLAEATTVVTYDRAGYGKSEVGTVGVDGLQTAKDLHTLLEKLAVARPVVLVGHSYGGKLARLHASTYPEDVAGLVLEDTGHEDMLEATKALLEGAEREAFERMSSQRPTEPGIRGAELEAMQRTHEQLRQAGPLPHVPLTVLTAGDRPVHPMFKGETARKVRELGQEFQEKLTRIIPGGKQIVVEGAGHNVHADQPDVVVEAIVAMITQIRTGGGTGT
jgi:pimeloyl-ACP methyl ester carboxylesterase